MAALRGLPFCMEPGLTVALTPPALDRDRFTSVTAVSGVRDGSALVFFAGIASIKDAEKIKGCHVLARRADLDLPEGSFAFEELIGRDVVDAAAGPLGRIAEVMESPAHDIWVVRGPAGEVLVPVVDELVGEIPEAGAIAVSLPSGLIGGEDA